ncbi:hypothetical protein BDZ89DRAFT_572243 [Hymenopellis radicata]|nr:hypothetical protein BDZ89DRAFT_572243 [Hymenopellis radicata]
MASKTTNIDSDLYGDIYGDDDVEFLTKDEQDESTEATMEEPAPSSSTSHNTLPNKPQNQSQPNISYSAQIAQQFSAYQQTPSQERQSKSPFLGGASIPTHHEGNGQSQSASDSVFGKKPSEMHDAG